MVLKINLLTVRTENIDAIGKADSGIMYVVFNSGATHNVKYGTLRECEADYREIKDVLMKEGAVKTMFVTVRPGRIDAIRADGEGGMFIVFKSAAVHHVKYFSLTECEADYCAIESAMHSEFLKLVEGEL